MRRFLLTLDMIDKLCLRSFSKNVKKLSIKFQNLKVNKNKRIRTKELHAILSQRRSLYKQQDTHYPKGSRFCEDNFLKLLIGSQHNTAHSYSQLKSRQRKEFTVQNLPFLGVKGTLLPIVLDLVLFSLT